MRYFVEIDRTQEGRCRARIHQGNPANGRELPDLKLHPEAAVNLKGKQLSLDQLVQLLIGFREHDLRSVFDERGQLELGQHLFSQIFHWMSPSERRRLQQAPLEIRIVTEDEHVGRLPWVLMADAGIFLSTLGWSVSLAGSSEIADWELPPSPRLLVAAPQPAFERETDAESHVERLEELLSSADGNFQQGRHLQVVSSWEEFVRAVDEFKPDVFYYYGHGVGNRDASRLVFTDDNGAKRVDKPIATVANCLRQMRRPPVLAYLNCCLGDAGGLLGAGRQLGNFIPAVVTNRTVARVDVAQRQALAFWQGVLLEGRAPHEAVAAMRSRLTDLDLDLSQVGWMTPVLHCCYDRWRANPPRPPSRLDRDPNWRLKLNRVPQFSQVFYLTSQMLLEQKPSSFVFAWYGEEDQGHDLFHQRLRVELQEKLRDVFFKEVKPSWPTELYNAERSFSDMLTEAFQVQTLDHIAGQVRAESRGVSGRHALVYVRHQPVQSRRVVNPQVFKSYLEWWDQRFVPLLDRRQFVLLGVSFVVGKPDVFRRALNDEGIQNLPLSKTVFNLLGEMGNVNKQDLNSFLDTHRIAVPQRRREQLLDEILRKTRGAYLKTLEALKELEFRAWESNGDALEASSRSYDYD